jgi:hypothetical protein
VTEPENQNRCRKNIENTSLSAKSTTQAKTMRKVPWSKV